jgi:hypothetical protein
MLEKADYLAIDDTNVLQIQNHLVGVRLEFKKPLQFSYRLCFESATQDEHCESPSCHGLNPESHRSGHFANIADEHLTSGCATLCSFRLPTGH